MLANRWVMLSVLFLARLTMGFQFQSVAALSPILVEQYGLTLADIGLLIGLYLAPGVAVAIPGGAIAARFGEKLIVCLGMVLMLVGGAMIALSAQWEILVAGRLLAGAGGVVLNIVMTKMLVDWFAEREISTAMAVFVNSWPVGIALALLALPYLESTGGLALAWWFTSAIIALGLIVLAVVYRAPAQAAQSASVLRVTKLPVYPLVLAGLIWALYNCALAMVFSFGPTLLTERGWSVAGAGSQISAFMIIFSLALPLGGILADRTGRRDLIILTSFVSFILFMPFVPSAPPMVVTILFVAVGVLFALAAGPIMTLPAVVLPPEARTFGMGVFFSIYYGVMMIAPRIGGGLADMTQETGVTFHFGAAMSLACIMALVLFRRASARISEAQATS